MDKCKLIIFYVFKFDLNTVFLQVSDDDFIFLQNDIPLANLEGAWGGGARPPKIIKDEGTRGYNDKCAHISVNSVTIIYLPLISYFISTIQTLLGIARYRSDH